MSVTVNLTNVMPDFLRETMANADKTFSAGKTEVVTTVALTAPRSLTIPLANSIPEGRMIAVVDEAGAISNSNYLTIAAAGSDLINGVATLILNVPYATVYLISNGISKYTVYNPARLTLNYFILQDTATNHKWKFTVDSTGMLSQPGEDLGL